MACIWTSKIFEQIDADEKQKRQEKKGRPFHGYQKMIGIVPNPNWFSVYIKRPVSKHKPFFSCQDFTKTKFFIKRFCDDFSGSFYKLEHNKKTFANEKGNFSKQIVKVKV